MPSQSARLIAPPPVLNAPGTGASAAHSHPHPGSDLAPRPPLPAQYVHDIVPLAAPVPALHLDHCRHVSLEVAALVELLDARRGHVAPKQGLFPDYCQILFLATPQRASQEERVKRPLVYEIVPLDDQGGVQADGDVQPFGVGFFERKGYAPSALEQYHGTQGLLACQPCAPQYAPFEHPRLISAHISLAHNRGRSLLYCVTFTVRRAQAWALIVSRFRRRYLRYLGNMRTILCISSTIRRLKKNSLDSIQHLYTVCILIAAVHSARLSERIISGTK
eukprot:CAMPEP_0173175102 /NCGR_PEP_ID=MMETSP1141-20130122/3712_1 /TAXON_ID=483371 /ORGANISM="non described non described, Strain CCMP2298" /LENGTH=276 /DNA_ID=CAMNT_0014097281 /DNA_START=1013 /DNA_END=1843 /DNA_ORIENTATION=+